MLPRKLQAKLEKTADMALAAYKARDFGLAASLIAQSGLEQHSPDLCNMKGVFLSAAGRIEDSVAAFEEALRQRPDFVEALSNKGNGLQKLGQLEDALVCYDKALGLRPAFADTWSNRGGVLQKMRRNEEALVAFEKAITLKPDFADAWFNKSVLHVEMNHLDEALADVKQAVALKQAYPEAWAHMAAVHVFRRELREALSAVETALKQKPNYAEAWSNFSAILREQGHTEQALKAADQALSLDPKAPKTLSNKGAALIQAGRYEEARACYEKALDILPDYPDLRFNLAILLLQLGDYEAGLREYEHRWERRNSVPRIIKTDEPEWQGEDLTGKILLVYTEQGLGDVLQFCRYFPLLREAGAARLLFLGDPRMGAILRQPLEGFELVHPDSRPQGDYRIALMSLPLHFGTKMDTIPNRIPYLSVDDERIAFWGDKIGTKGLRIGIAWQGNPNAEIDLGRSFPLSSLAPLALLSGVRLISLQKRHGLEQLTDLPEGMSVETLDNFDEGPEAFCDTAAVMMNLDLIVTSDTSVAHLAGALGRKTFLALQKTPDWRWHLEREDSPWYPSLKLFRQKERGNWPEVFARITEAVRAETAHM